MLRRLHSRSRPFSASLLATTAANLGFPGTCRKFAADANTPGDPYHDKYFDFGSPKYWDDFYHRKLRSEADGAAAVQGATQGAGWFEWFETADSALPAIEAVASKVARNRSLPDVAGGLDILHVGSGTSSLGFRLAEAGHNVCNVDVCEEALAFLESQAAASHSDGNSSKPTGTNSFVHLDVLDIAKHFGPESFDLVVDKGTLDALLFRGLDPARDMCRAICTVLREGGAYAQLTREDPELRMEAFAIDDLPWSVSWHAVSSSDSGLATSELFDETPFLFVCSKNHDHAHK